MAARGQILLCLNMVLFSSGQIEQEPWLATMPSAKLQETGEALAGRFCKPKTFVQQFDSSQSLELVSCGGFSSSAHASPCRFRNAAAGFSAAGVSAFAPWGPLCEAE